MGRDTSLSINIAALGSHTGHGWCKRRGRRRRGKKKKKEGEGGVVGEGEGEGVEREEKKRMKKEEEKSYPKNPPQNSRIKFYRQ